MTNQEMILAYNGIMQFQNMEQKKFEESGKKILSGKIQLAFSINKNKAAIVQALQPYEETKKSIIEEYRDTAAERKAWEEEQKAAEAEKRPVQDISIVSVQVKVWRSIKENLMSWQSRKPILSLKKCHYHYLKGWI